MKKIKKILNYFFVPVVLSTTLIQAACKSDFDVQTENKLNELKQQIKIINSKFEEKYTEFNNFFNDINSEKLNKFQFYYENIQKKAKQYSSILNQFNEKIKSNINFELKKNILNTFFKETDLRENKINTYIDAWIRFNAINDELLALIQQNKLQPNESNSFYYFKNTILNNLIENFTKSNIFDEKLSQTGLKTVENEYKSHWYNFDLKSIDYNELGKKIIVDGNEVIQHTHALGNVLKEWSIIVPNLNGIANQKINELVKYLNENINKIENFELKNIIKQLNNAKDEFEKSVKELTNQFNGDYPIEKILGYFDENSPFSKMIDLWKQANEIYAQIN
ncbi:MAG0770 family lipoprotein [Mycoplasmopsis cricetuli]|uniref:MAG0770 family lipoprotein n=1 Tax=Mycoplasmopsis cricetuli TaxID=171283 RepID=UPI00047052FD|nr:hypothetical protein [Mycoplasmopsis cricetuli]